MPKKRHLTPFFLKLLFFCSLLLLLNPETLPNLLFRQTNDQQWSKKLPKGEKKNSFFFSVYFTFSLSPSGKIQKHLPFPPFLSPQIGKPQGKTSLKNFFFFFFFFTSLHPTASRNRKNYHLPFSSKFRLQVP